MDIMINSILTGPLSATQIILVAFVGALVGEFFRETHDDDPVDIPKFLSKWAASGFLGVMIGLIAKEMFFQNKPLIVIGIVGYLSYNGNKNSSQLLSKIVNNLLGNDRKNKEDDKKES